jgi:hypothetical protein
MSNASVRSDWLWLPRETGKGKGKGARRISSVMMTVTLFPHTTYFVSSKQILCQPAMMTLQHDGMTEIRCQLWIAVRCRGAPESVPCALRLTGSCGKHVAEVHCCNLVQPLLQCAVSARRILETPLERYYNLRNTAIPLLL